ncbi:DUF4189 domain-containing protein [Nocardia sp. NPDC051981]|uniref:DUF4189 domain-containing protein n=1 Tax=Nocardia sp. NPDC051981 TaxID=3155417 RepID=UPI00341B48D6
MSLSHRIGFGVVAFAGLAASTVTIAHADEEGPGPAPTSFGALAASIDRATGQMVRYGWGVASDQGNADASALNDCGSSNCVVVLRFQDECAAVARYQGYPSVWAVGPTRADAERNAVTTLGPSHDILGPLDLPQVGKSACTANVQQ